MARAGQSRPDSGLGSQVKFLKTFLSCALFARERRGDADLGFWVEGSTRWSTPLYADFVDLRFWGVT